MRLFPRRLPPAGTPISLADVLAYCPGLANPEVARQRLRELIKRETGARHCLLTGSGRTALWLVLEAMKGLSGEEGRETILLPAYTCASLPSAVLRADLKPVPVRLDEATLDYREDALAAALERHRPLAVLAVNLFGMPGRSPRWAAMAKEAGAYFVDDAAQTLGSWCAGRPSGRWGDAGFYSLARGKNITAMGGGILVTDRDDLAEVLQREAGRLGVVSRRREIRTVVEAVAFWALLRRRLFWLARHIPGVRFQVFEIDPAFAARQMGGVQAALACRSWRRLAAGNAIRRINGQRLRAALAPIPGVRIPVPSGGFASWLRLPILFDDPESRDRAAAALTQAGLGATVIYPSAWHRLDGCPITGDRGPGAAGDLPARLLSLTTHHLVRPADVAAVARIVARSVDGGAGR
jgi:dTDP-4-amino-4,6-dideoxygalactose transaminase